MKKWKLWTGMILIFIAGGAVGTIGTGLFVKHKIVSIIEEGQPVVEKLAVRILSRRLDLTADQKSETARIIRETQQRLQAIRLRVRPDALEIITTGKEDIRALLDPDQKKTLDQLYTKMKRRWETHGWLPATLEQTQ
jgi:hypothetical protein